ncbi:50S ribosomal protein L23 [Buchnera aphidicola]|uniref:50S ribosomal protein L23 n=1 Tax=Buchnera aphidicola TaxID=9 RepID=UPI003463C9B7
MISKDRLFDILYSPHISEKSSILSEKNNKITFKVSFRSNKHIIKLAVEKLFSVDVQKVNIICMKGKKKNKGKKIIVRNNWKKAYVTLKKGQKLDFMNNF